MRERDFLLVHTRPNCEGYAARFLSSKPFDRDVYVPMARVRVSHSRKIQYVNRPFLSRYILVRVGEQATFRLNGAPGVSCVVAHSISRTPIVVGERFVEQLREREVEGAIPVGPQEEKARFRTGDPVYVKSRDLNGIYSCTCGTRRAVVFLGMLKARVKLNDLELLN